MNFLSYLFGCRHPRQSFPQTIRGRKRPKAAALTGTYTACLDCGEELPYDWAQMKVVSAREQRARFRMERKQNAV